jgi:hypothetical protein
MAHSLGGDRRDGSNAEIAEAAETLIVLCVFRGLGVDIVSAPSAPCARHQRCASSQASLDLDSGLRAPGYGRTSESTCPRKRDFTRFIAPCLAVMPSRETIVWNVSASLRRQVSASGIAAECT